MNTISLKTILDHTPDLMKMQGLIFFPTKIINHGADVLLNSLPMYSAAFIRAEMQGHTT